MSRHALGLLVLLAACQRPSGTLISPGDAPSSAATVPAAPASATSDTTVGLTLRNRSTSPLSYGELIVGGTSHILPILGAGEVAIVQIDAPAGSPIVVRYQSAGGLRTDTVGIHKIPAAANEEIALTDVGAMMVRRGN